jgi:Na+/phosphate symporter
MTNNRLEWIIMGAGLGLAIVSIIIAITTNESFTWQAIAAVWIGNCMIKQGTIENLTKK